MIFAILFLSFLGVTIWLSVLDFRKRADEKRKFSKWQNQVLAALEKISNKY